MDSLADILSLSVTLRILRWVSLSIDFESTFSFLLGKIIFDKWLVSMLFVWEIVVGLILLDHLFEGVSVNTLLLVVTEYHSLCFNLVFWHNFVVLSCVWVLLKPEFFNTVAIHLEFWKLIMSIVFVSRHVWVKIKDTFIRCFKIPEQVVDVLVINWQWLYCAVLGLLCFSSRWELKFVHDIFSQWSLSSVLLNWFSQKLLRVVLWRSMLWKVLTVFTVNNQVKVSKVMKVTLCK